jgi:hypothetical protein
MVAAAIVGVGLAGAVGSGIAGSEAAGATTSATNAAVGEQNAALQQQAQLAAPYTGVGQAAIPGYENLLGIGSQGSAGIMQALQQTPGYQFALSQGETGIKNAASAQGGISGNTLAALDQYNQGEASQTYQQNVGDIQGAVGIGQAAAAGQASNIGTAAGNISGLVENQGQTTAGIDANTVAGLTQSLGGIGQNYVTMNALNALNSQAQLSPVNVTAQYM